MKKITSITVDDEVLKFLLESGFNISAICNKALNEKMKSVQEFMKKKDISREELRELFDMGYDLEEEEPEP